MNLKKAAIIVNIAACIMLTATGLFLAVEPSDQADANFYVIVSGIAFSFISIIFWSQSYSKKSLKAKRVRDLAIQIFSVLLILSALATLYAVFGLNN